MLKVEKCGGSATSKCGGGLELPFSPLPISLHTCEPYKGMYCRILKRECCVNIKLCRIIFISKHYTIIVELMLRRNMYTVTEEDPGFDSSVLIFVDVIVIRSPAIGIDLNFTVSSSTAISMYQSAN